MFCYLVALICVLIEVNLGKGGNSLSPILGYTFSLLPVSSNSTIIPRPLINSAFGVNRSDQSIITIVGGKDEAGLVTDSVFQYFLNTSIWVQIPLLFSFTGNCYSQWVSTDGASSSNLYLYSDTYPRQLGVVSMDGDLNVTILSSADVILKRKVGIILPTQLSCTLTKNMTDSSMKFYMFGGKKQDSSCSTSVYYYDELLNDWFHFQFAAGSAGPPEGRTGASFVNIDDTSILMVGGGCGEFLSPMAVWRLDTVKKLWSVDVPYRPDGLQPDPRTGHSTILDVTSRPYSILLYGGTDGVIDFDDLWRYDLSINQWTVISQSVNSSWPHARAQAATTSIPGSLLIFGGEMTYEGTMNNELWQLALNDDCFKYKNCQDCAIITGCGWCKLNDVGYQCISGMYKHPFSKRGCLDEKTFIADYSNCQPAGFPSWIVALMVIAVSMILGVVGLYMRNDPPHGSHGSH